jgi:hypothetical protein
MGVDVQEMQQPNQRVPHEGDTTPLGRRAEKGDFGLVVP